MLCDNIMLSDNIVLTDKMLYFSCKLHTLAKNIYKLTYYNFTLIYILSFSYIISFWKYPILQKAICSY
jgi:hypothetical protein